MLVLAAERAAGAGTGAAAVAGLTEQLGENVAESVVFALGVLAVEGALGGLALGVDFAAVETGASLRIAQQFVRRRGGLESGLGGRVPGVEVGVMFLGQLAVGSLDLLRGGGLGDAQRLVGVLCHGGNM